MSALIWLLSETAVRVVNRLLDRRLFVVDTSYVRLVQVPIQLFDGVSGTSSGSLAGLNSRVCCSDSGRGLGHPGWLAFPGLVELVSVLLLEALIELLVVVSLTPSGRLGLCSRRASIINQH